VLLLVKPDAREALGLQDVRPHHFHAGAVVCLRARDHVLPVGVICGSPAGAIVVGHGRGQQRVGLPCAAVTLERHDGGQHTLDEHRVVHLQAAQVDIGMESGRVVSLDGPRAWVGPETLADHTIAVGVPVARQIDVVPVARPAARVRSGGLEAAHIGEALAPGIEDVPAKRVRLQEGHRSVGADQQYIFEAGAFTPQLLLIRPDIVPEHVSRAAQILHGPHQHVIAEEALVGDELVQGMRVDHSLAGDDQVARAGCRCENARIHHREVRTAELACGSAPVDDDARVYGFAEGRRLQCMRRQAALRAQPDLVAGEAACRGDQLIAAVSPAERGVEDCGAAIQDAGKREGHIPLCHAPGVGGPLPAQHLAAEDDLVDRWQGGQRRGGWGGKAKDCDAEYQP